MKRFLNKPKTRAALWMADCAIYMMLAELLRLWGIRLGAVFALLIGMYCAAGCFSCGREYERQLWKIATAEIAVPETDTGESAHGEERKV